MARSPRSSCAVAVALLLTLTACGSRADDSLRQQASAAALGGGGNGAGAGGSTSGGAADGGSAGGSGGSTSGTGGSTSGGSTGVSSTGGTSGGSTGGSSTGGTSGGTTGKTSGGSGGTSGTSTGSAPAPAGGNGGSTDIGVTGTEITIGNISDEGGPRPGLFRGARVGTSAYLNKINSEGGVFGRKLKMDFGDSALDCAKNKAETSNRLKKVFAYVGSFSLFDDCGTSVLKNNTNIPDIHNALGGESQNLTTNFSIAPLGKGWRTGSLKYYNDKFGPKWKNIGTIYAGVGSGPALWNNTKSAIKNGGGAIAHEESYGATDSDFTGAVVRMQSDGVQMVYLNTTDGPTGANIVNAIRAQGLDWPVVFGGTAYAPDFLSKIKGNNDEGILNDSQFSLFFNKDEASRLPAAAEFQKWMGITDRSQQLDIFASYGWASANLFVEALKKAGPKANRADLLKALRSITTFDSAGLFAPANPAGKVPATCWIVAVIKSHQFVRVDSPANKFRCDGGYYNNPNPGK